LEIIVREKCGLPHHINYFCSPTYHELATNFGSLVNTCVCLKQNTLASNKTTDLADLTDLFIPIMTDSADFRFLGESPSGWLQEPCEALIRVIRINPSNGLPISENLFNPLNLWLKIKISAQSAQSFRRNLFI
jgi:hypothetical protein